MLTDDQIREALHEMLIDVLAVDAEELTPHARFFEDLDGESIDLLELSFRCEQRFRTKVEFQHLLTGVPLETDSDGRLTDAAYDSLRAQLPFLATDDLRNYARIDDLRQLMTVKNLFRCLRHVLRSAGKAESVAITPPANARVTGA